MAERIAELTDGRVKLRPGNLYRIIDRLIDGGLAEEVDRRDPGEDERRRYFRATPAGTKAAREQLAMYGRVLDRVGLDRT